MENFTRQIFDILISPPGNLVYHLILAFAVVISLQAALVNRRRAPALAGRMLLGLGMMLVAQLVLFAGSGLAWQQIARPQQIQPALDRAMTAFALLWATWLWCFPKPNRAADALVSALSLAVGVLMLFTVNVWLAQNPAATFNGTFYDRAWAVFSLFLAGVGLLALLLARPPAWEIGFAMLGLMLAGFVAHLLLPPMEENYAGAVRLAQLCAYPLLPVVANRLGGIATGPGEPVPAVRIERDELGPRARQAWLRLLTEEDPGKIPQGLARAMAQSLRADMCLLLAAPGPDLIWNARAGYDLVGDQPLPPVRLDSKAIPALSAALQRGKPVVLPASAAPAPDQVAIGRALGLEDTGGLLAVPLISKGKVWGAIALLSPYTVRSWNEAEQRSLEGDAENLVLVLQNAQTATDRQDEMETWQRDAKNAAERAEQLAQENQRLAGELNIALSRPAPEPPENSSAQVEALVALQAEAQVLITRLQEENEQLRATVTTRPSRVERSAETAALQDDLRMTLEEIAHLQGALAEADSKIKTLEQAGRQISPQDPQNNELLLSITQELRQPMTSIAGYCNLLMVESAGALTTLQQTFLERIKSSSEQMQSELDDLVYLVASRTDQGLPQQVDLNDLIDQAVAKNSALLRRKGLTLRMDLPEQAEMVRVRPQAVRQILVNLVRNAGSISPEGSAITLRAALEGSGAGRVLTLWVKDSGGGVPSNQSADVFKAHARASQPLTQGVADGGFGLAVARKLAQAQGGDIDLESEPGKSTTYRVRIPLAEHETAYPIEAR